MIADPMQDKEKVNRNHNRPKAEIVNWNSNNNGKIELGYQIGFISFFLTSIAYRCANLLPENLLYFILHYNPSCVHTLGTTPRSLVTETAEDLSYKERRSKDEKSQTRE